MTTAHDPMRVEYITDGTSTRPEPPCNDEWTPLDKLRWKAGCVEARTGVRVEIVTGCAREKVSDEWVETPGQYGYHCRGAAGASYSYREMWVWLSGFESGARSVRRERK